MKDKVYALPCRALIFWERVPSRFTSQTLMRRKNLSQILGSLLYLNSFLIRCNLYGVANRQLKYEHFTTYKELPTYYAAYWYQGAATPFVRFFIQKGISWLRKNLKTLQYFEKICKTLCKRKESNLHYLIFSSVLPIKTTLTYFIYFLLYIYYIIIFLKNQFKFLLVR